MFVRKHGSIFLFMERVIEWLEKEKNQNQRQYLNKKKKKKKELMKKI